MFFKNTLEDFRSAASEAMKPCLNRDKLIKYIAV